MTYILLLCVDFKCNIKFLLFSKPASVFLNTEIIEKTGGAGDLEHEQMEQEQMK